MITALISALTGLLSGVVPDILKEVRDSRAHKREIEHLELQSRLQLERDKADAQAKIRQADASIAVADADYAKAAMQAIMEAQSKPTGVPWLDALNAFVRPATALMMMVLFMWTAAIFVSGVMDAYAAGKIATEMALATVIWNSMLGEAIMAVLGFLFGYRSTVKRGA